MSARGFATLLLSILAMAGCDRSTKPTEPVPAGPEYLEILVMAVGPTLTKCYGFSAAPQSCMVVNGEFFYEEIEGFEYEAGYDYRLRVGKYDPWGGSEPPQDVSLYAYRLLERLEKTLAPSTPATLSVGPARVICAWGDDFCIVVDGALYDDYITGFEYKAGYHYILEASRYGDGRYVLGEVVSRTRASGTEEEITFEPHRVQCGEDDPRYCSVVNGAPYRGEIVGFLPWYDYVYRLRVEKFSMFPDGMAGSPDVPSYGYRWLETLEKTPNE